MGATLRGLEKVRERNVDEREPGLGQQLVSVPQLAAHEDSTSSLVLDPRLDRERAIDRDRPAVAQEHPACDGREAVPRRREPAGLVDQRRDDAAVREARPALVTLVEREGRLVAVGALGLRLGKVESDRVVAAPEARRVVVRRDLQRMPPRSKCALKKFSDPDVAIADEAEISSANVAAATIWANRYTFPGPAQSIRPSHARA